MNNKKKWYIAGAIVIVLLLVLFAGRVKKNGGLTAPKEIAFGKTSGERVWFGTDGGKDKDAIVDYVYVTKGKKMIQYQIFDNDITLGKVSKMDNSEVIKMAKKQDRKYFDKSVDEVKALRDGERQIGLQNDMWGDKQVKKVVANGPILFVVGDKSDSDQWSNTKLVTRKEFLKYREGGTHTNLQLATASELNPADSIMVTSENEKAYKDVRNEMNNKRYKYIIEHGEHVKYLAPKWQTVKYSDTKTDDSGNNVVEQTIDYKSIDEFGEYDDINNSIFSLPKSKQQQIASIITKYNNINEAYGRGHDPKPGDEVNISELKRDLNNTFDSSYYKAVAKSVIHPHIIDDWTTVHTAPGQQIYDSKFIGYQSDDGTYLLTKAQNDNQKAVLTK